MKISQTLLILAIIIRSTLLFSQTNQSDFNNTLKLSKLNFSNPEAAIRSDSIIQSFGKSTLSVVTTSSDDLTYMLDSSLVETWDTTGNEWKNYYKYNQEYNSYGNITYYSSNYWIDSTNSWKGNSATSKEYNENQNLTESIFYLSNDSSLYKWRGFFYEYNSKGDISSCTYSSWNSSSETWIALSKYEYTYDANFNLTKYETQNYDTETSTWIGDNLEEHYYDDNNNDTLYVVSYYDETTEDWTYTEKHSYEYDSQNLMIETINATWEFDEWSYNTKVDYTYNSEGLQSKIETYSILGSSYESLKYTEEYSYNSNQDITEYTKYQGSSLTPYEKEEYTYDSDWNVTKYIEYEGNSSGFTPEYKTEYEFDKDGNKTLYAYYKWDEDGDSSRWFGYDKSVYSFNSEDQCTQSQFYCGEYLYDTLASDEWILFEQDDYEYTDSDTSLIKQITEYNVSNSVYSKDHRYTYYYSIVELDELSTTSAIKELTADNLDITISPNPATETITISGSELNEVVHFELYNLNGQLVSNKLVEQGGNISTSNLSNGLYLWKAQSDNKTTTGKLLKE